jgi:hypothetical protein
LTFGGGRCCGPFGAGAATVRQPAGDADVGVDAEPPAAVLVVEPAAVLLVEVLVELLPQPASPMTIATANHALRTGSEQSRSPYLELLTLPKLSVDP